MKKQSISTRLSPCKFTGFLTFIMCLVFYTSFSQVDVLENKLKTATGTEKIEILNELSSLLSSSSPDKSIEYANEAYELAANSNNKTQEVTALVSLGNAYCSKGNFQLALEHHQKSLKIYEDFSSKQGMISSLNNIAGVYKKWGKSTKAIEYYKNALNISKELGEKKSTLYFLQTIADIYYKQNKYEKSIEYHKKSLNLMYNKEDIANTCSNIGSIYTFLARTNISKFKNAIEYLKKSLKIYEELGYKNKTAITLKNIGVCYNNWGNYKEALKYFEKCLKIAKSINQTELINSVSKFIEGVKKSLAQGPTEFEKEKIQEEKEYISEIEDLSLQYLKESQLKDIELSIKEEALDTLTKRQIALMYEADKKKKEIELLNKDKLLKDLEIEKKQEAINKQRMIMLYILSGSIVILFFLIIVFIQYRQKKKANKVLARQKEEISKKNILITDSITYAKLIQEAILPSEKLMKTHLPDSFIFFKPRDIVSGDFYWFSEQNGKLFVAVVDCTGHGVPGAFMSIIGNTLLNEIVNNKKVHSPAKILEELNAGVVYSLNQGPDREGSQDDGMDITMCCIDKLKKEIQIASANHTSYIISSDNAQISPDAANKSGQIRTIQGDIFSIGGMFSLKPDQSFKNHLINIEKETIIYMFSDGYQDQIGGKEGEKFMADKFKKMLLENHHLEMQEQLNMINQTYDNWKGNRKQIDDILVIGIRV